MVRVSFSAQSLGLPAQLGREIEVQKILSTEEQAACKNKQQKPLVTQLEENMRELQLGLSRKPEDACLKGSFDSSELQVSEKSSYKVPDKELQ